MEETRSDPEVIYHDQHVLVLNKPAGMLVHTVRSGVRGQGSEVRPTVVDWLLARYPEVRGVGDDPATRPGIVHRLDRDTSGVLVVARDAQAFAFLKQQFAERTVKKTYAALVWGAFKEEKGVIEKPIGLAAGTTKRTVWVKHAKMVKSAQTRYEVRAQYPSSALVRVEPMTGRTHQIRVHLASIGHPIIGDALYGSKAAKEYALRIGLTRPFLHAEAIEFTASPGRRLKASADLPTELVAALAKAQDVPADRPS